MRNKKWFKKKLVSSIELTIFFLLLLDVYNPTNLLKVALTFQVWKLKPSADCRVAGPIGIVKDKVGGASDYVWLRLKLDISVNL